jgi:hypothetical protein
MGQLYDREAWEKNLPRDVVDALEAWLAGETFDLGHREWFTEGRSGGPVARVVRDDPDEGTRQLILKFCDSDGERKISILRRARKQPPLSFCDKHLTETEDQTLRLDGWRAVFMHVAGGDLDIVRPLGELLDKDEFPGYCGKIVGSVVNDWNEGRVQRESKTVAEVLNEIVSRRRGEAESWASQSGIAVDGAPQPLPRTGWSEPLPNPFTLLAGAEANQTLKDLIVGKAHGDLSGRNIFLRTKPVVAPDSYVLIDYDHFTNRAPLARDPMHLLVALALDRLDHFAAWRPDLAMVLVDPHTRDASPHVGHFRKISAAIHEASAEMAKRAGMGAQWTHQCLLSLVGVGLVHLGRKLRANDPSAAQTGVSTWRQSPRRHIWGRSHRRSVSMSLRRPGGPSP